MEPEKHQLVKWSIDLDEKLIRTSDARDRRGCLGEENKGWELPGRNDRVCLVGFYFLYIYITLVTLINFSFKCGFPKSSRNDDKSRWVQAVMGFDDGWEMIFDFFFCRVLNHNKKGTFTYNKHVATATVLK